METVGKPPADAELHLLTDWSDPVGRSRAERAGVFSVLVHVALIVFIVVVPESIMQPPARKQTESVVVTPLIEPLSVLTQKDPNTNKPDKVFNATHIEPHPRPNLRPSPPTAAPAQAPAPTPAPPTPKPPQQVALPEPPKVETPNETPKLTLPVGPPQIQAVEKPHPGFEDVTAPRQVPPEQRVLPIPGPTVENAINGALHSGGASNPAVAPPGPPATAALPQLLSDPQGVDFRPYLARVLAAVQNRWFAIMPDAVKQGRTGRVGLQIRIQRDGAIGKVVYVGSTGVPALDNAAFAAISAASPFPPLPPAFRGTTIDVQINFEYNKKKE
jgi:TonB family protein